MHGIPIWDVTVGDESLTEKRGKNELILHSLSHQTGVVLWVD